MTSMAQAERKPQTSFRKAARPANTRQTHRNCPRVTLRFSEEDYARLKELADGIALATYIRAQVLSEDLPRRKRRSTPTEDKQAVAQMLGLLGQSRIANNLNQLAYHANVGSLAMDDVARGQIDEAYEHILFMRNTLMKALGLRA